MRERYRSSERGVYRVIGLHVESLRLGWLAEETLVARSLCVVYSRCYWLAWIQHLETRIWLTSSELYVDCNGLGSERKMRWWHDAECEGILPQGEGTSGV